MDSSDVGERPTPNQGSGLLVDRTVIVSGVGPGMGRDAALACARQGANIVLAARSQDRLEAVAEEVRAVGANALCAPTDVTDVDQIKEMVTAATYAFGQIDVVVNNAFKQPPFETLEDMSLDTWQQSMDLNCTAALKVSRAVLPQMRKQGSGSIVNVATMSIRNNKPNFGAYAAAKSALTSMTRTMANEVGPDGIRVNAICPGFIFGDSVRWYLNNRAESNGTTYQDEYDAVASEIALRFIPDSHQICGSVVFLASDLAAAVTGVSLDVNGGHLMSA